MRTRVVGVTFSNDDGSSRTRIIAGMTESDKICIERDPYNQYDANAVKVCVLKNGEKKQIGFLAKEIAAEISPKLRRSVNFNISIAGVGIWNDRPFCELDIKEAPSAPKVESQNSSASPTFNPSRPVSSGPTFNPNRSANTSTSPSPNFTPKSSVQSSPSGPAFTPHKVSTVQNTSSVSSSGNANNSTHNTTTQSNPNQKKSGCLGIVLGIIVIITALLMY